MLGKRGHGRRTPERLTVSASVILLLGVIITAIVFIGARALEHDKSVLEFERRAQTKLETVRDGFHGAVDVLEMVNQLFTIFESVDRDQFRLFVTPLLDQYPYVRAFAYHRYVSDAERPAYEAEMRQRYPDFRITELAGEKMVTAGRRERYRVVDYIEPFKGNERRSALMPIPTTSRSMHCGGPSIPACRPRPACCGWYRRATSSAG